MGPGTSPGPLHLQVVGFNSLQTHPLHNNTKLRITVTLTSDGNPANVLVTDVPRGVQLQEVAAYVKGNSFKDGRPIDEMQRLLSGVKHVASDIFKAKETPTHASRMNFITARLVTVGDRLCDAAPALVNDMNNRVYVSGRPSPSRVMFLEQADNALLDAEAGLKYVLRDLAREAIITQPQYKKWVHIVRFNRLKIRIFLYGFQACWFI